MRNPKLTLNAILAVAGLLVASSMAQAQATRTWVSGVGDDANPCSRTAPCKTFAGAISKTAAGGEINVLDPGGFGVVTITKSISIVNDGAVGGILASLTNGVIINAGVNDVVVLRGLDIDGANNGLNGVRFLAGAALHVQDCVIRNFTTFGIDFQPSGASKLYVDDSIISDNAPTGATGGGILVKPTATGSARAQIHNTRLQGSRVGLQVEARGNATVTQSVASGNLAAGYLATSTTTAAILALDDSPATHNVNDGVLASGVGAFVRMSNMLIFGNNIGANNNGGSIVSFGNNRILGNATAQTSGTITPQPQQ